MRASDRLRGCDVAIVGSASSLSLTEWYRLLANPGEEDESLLNDARGETTLTLGDEFVATLDGREGESISFEETTRVRRVVDAILASDRATQGLERR